MTPKDLVWSRGKVCLWRYRSDARHGTPIVLFLGLLSRPYVFDLQPGNSLVIQPGVEEGHAQIDFSRQ